jgi:hypothetical protein
MRVADRLRSAAEDHTALAGNYSFNNHRQHCKNTALNLACIALLASADEHLALMQQGAILCAATELCTTLRTHLAMTDPHRAA